MILSLYWIMAEKGKGYYCTIGSNDFRYWWKRVKVTVLLNLMIPDHGREGER